MSFRFMCTAMNHKADIMSASDWLSDKKSVSCRNALNLHNSVMSGSAIQPLIISAL